MTEEIAKQINNNLKRIADALEKGNQLNEREVKQNEKYNKVAQKKQKISFKNSAEFEQLKEKVKKKRQKRKNRINEKSKS